MLPPELPSVPPEVRAQLHAELAAHGLPHLVAELAETDPVAHARIDQQNPQRIVRALEITRATGRPFSSFHSEGPPPENPMFRNSYLAGGVGTWELVFSSPTLPVKRCGLRMSGYQCKQDIDNIYLTAYYRTVVLPQLTEVKLRKN